jgi:hypothetical protein
MPCLCFSCEGFKAPRAHHCRKCERCVLKMDHHCPWINNCVGHFNHGHFTGLKHGIFCSVKIQNLIRLSLYKYSVDNFDYCSAFLASAVCGCCLSCISLSCSLYYGLNRYLTATRSLLLLPIFSAGENDFYFGILLSFILLKSNNIIEFMREKKFRSNKI